MFVLLVAVVSAAVYFGFAVPTETGTTYIATATPALTLGGATPIISSCEPTYQDPPGPYIPGAPVRSSVGKGHILRGTIRSSRDCAPISGARIELWPSDENDLHDAGARATVFSVGAGAYYFECNFPNHIHIRVSADGYKPLITNAYHPRKGEAEGRFDIVMQIIMQPAP